MASLEGVTVVMSFDEKDGSTKWSDDVLSMSDMAMLSCGLGGLQLVWSTIFAPGTDYLLSLGIPKSLTALLWAVIPICGTFVQPIFGILSDQSSSIWGRRTPFIAAGAAGVTFSMIGLAWTRSSVTLLEWVAGVSHDGHSTILGFLSAFWMCALRIAVQPLQLSLRALVLDKYPREHQIRASAWSSASIGVGNILGYLLASTELPMFSPFTRLSQFQSEAVVVSCCLLLSVVITCLAAREAHFKTMRSAKLRAKFSTTVMHMAYSTGLMDGIIYRVFQIQFVSWLGWFSVLFYQAIYLTDLYVSPKLLEQPWMPHSEVTTIHQHGLRHATSSGLAFAVVSMLSSILIPSAFRRYFQCHRQESRLSAERPALALWWAFGHLWFAFSMFVTTFIRSFSQGAIMACFVGVPSALNTWFPFAIIGSEVAKAEGSMEGNGASGFVSSLHNATISSPQILAAFLSAIIFSVAASSESERAVVWVLDLGGVWALLAAYKSLALRRYLATSRNEGHL